jgi:hypothetical protein
VTRKPPDPLPDPGLVLADGTVIPGEDAVIAWHNAYIEHRRALRAEAARYAAVCVMLRERFGPPAGAPRGEAFPAQAWHQARLEDLDPPDTDDQAAFSSPSGEWFAADAAAYLPPCERES